MSDFPSSLRHFFDTSLFFRVSDSSNSRLILVQFSFNSRLIPVAQITPRFFVLSLFYLCYFCVLALVSVSCFFPVFRSYFLVFAAPESTRAGKVPSVVCNNLLLQTFNLHAQGKSSLAEHLSVPNNIQPTRAGKVPELSGNFLPDSSTLFNRSRIHARI